jgi:hypothetical protein
MASTVFRGTGFEKEPICRKPGVRICKRLRSPEIDSNKSAIPPAYVAWRADTANLFLGLINVYKFGLGSMCCRPKTENTSLGNTS